MNQFKVNAWLTNLLNYNVVETIIFFLFDFHIINIIELFNSFY